MNFIILAKNWTLITILACGNILIRRNVLLCSRAECFSLENNFFVQRRDPLWSVFRGGASFHAKVITSFSFLFKSAQRIKLVYTTQVNSAFLARADWLARI